MINASEMLITKANGLQLQYGTVYHIVVINVKIKITKYLETEMFTNRLLALLKCKVTNFVLQFRTVYVFTITTVAEHHHYNSWNKKLSYR